jgi:hypothetical protein|nr:MAG TPA: helix-turn-helix domain protein [Caudoviricetes sp.]
MIFGEKIKFLRDYKKMTQQQFADLLGTTKQTISRYESTEREPNLRTVIEYANKLDVPVLALVDNGVPIIRTDVIKRERANTNSSQAKFAASLGIPADRYAQIEDGKIMPTVEELKRIADVICYSLDDLISNTWLLDTSDEQIRMSTLSANEKAIVNLFRKCPGVDKGDIITLLENYSNLGKDDRISLLSYSDYLLHQKDDKKEKPASAG